MVPLIECDRDLLRVVLELMDRGEAFVLATVVRTQGSTPRDAGARMIWRPDGSIVGTVGGGQFELMVMDAAQQCFSARAHAMEHFVLGAEAGQCCGGTMDVFLEYHAPGVRVVIFGAGHVSLALARVLASTGLSVAIVDDRCDWNNAERFPTEERVLSFDEGVALVSREPERTLACIMTCSHDTDFEILCGVLKHPTHFVGLIGSRSKRACFVTRLSAAGFDENAILRVRCPIGVGDTGKEPHAVAISIAAQLLIEAKSLAPA